jgi:glutaredoxin
MSSCPHCQNAKDHFKDNNISYEEIEISEDPVVQQHLLSRTGSRAIPQIEIGNEIMFGFDEKRVKELMDKYNVT